MGRFLQEFQIKFEFRGFHDWWIESTGFQALKFLICKIFSFLILNFVWNFSKKQSFFIQQLSD